MISEEDKRAHELILAKEIRMQAEAVQLVRDASEKWLSQVPDQKRNDIEQLAIQFLLAMDSTLCFFTVSLRMIALAPWKDSMVAIDVRQAAVVAISKGWYVKSDPFNAWPFSRAELALAAGSYLGKITPTLADDATVALRAIVELLPIVCDEFFAKVSLACPFCQAKAVGVAPIFSTAVTWRSLYSVSLFWRQVFWEYLEDLGAVHGEFPASIWQWSKVRDLLVRNATTFSIQQCLFGASFFLSGCCMAQRRSLSGRSPFCQRKQVKVANSLEMFP